MQPDFWHQRWLAAQTPFHQSVTNRYLTIYGSRFPLGKVLVPLCGKSLDMKWLEESGREVMGVELSPIACRAYFEEQGRPVEETRSGAFTKFSNGKAKLWCGDFFELKPADCEDVVAIYDQACLIAFPQDMRKRYIAHLETLVAGRKVPMLLNTMEYPQTQMEGPPFSISQEEVERSFGPFATLLETVEVYPTSFENVPRLLQKCYWIEHGRI